jgi:hypothetical protein
MRPQKAVKNERARKIGGHVHQTLPSMPEMPADAEHFTGN